MDCAIITGADNPVGQVIVRQVVGMGFRVFGLGQFKTVPSFEHPQYHPLGCDLTQPGKIAQVAQTIQGEGKVVSVLIQAAPLHPALAERSRFDACSPGNVETALRLQFLGPVLLTRLFLPQLLASQGHVVFVSPQDAEAMGSDPLLSGAVAGLRRFAGQLYDGYRDSGLRVTSLFLQGNAGSGPLQVSERQEHINPRQVSRALEQVLQSGAEGNVMTELVLRPQTADGAARVQKLGAAVDVYREIILPPPEKFPTEVTFAARPVARSRPTIEPEDLDQVDLPEPELRESAEPPPRKVVAEPREHGEPPSEGGERRRRRSRRGRGRGRGRGRSEDGRSGAQSGGGEAAESTRNAGQETKPDHGASGNPPRPPVPAAPAAEAAEKPAGPVASQEAPARKKSAARKKRSAAKKKTDPSVKKVAAKKKSSPRKKAASKKSAARKKTKSTE